MFKWYRGASKCYVYLPDVSIHDDDHDKFSRYNWESAFRKSKWYTRGWTLQELIAPASVEFFSVEGKFLGDKKSLQQQIHEITGISLQALQGESMSQFDFAERMSWATTRQTTIEEDAAYCLLGIFDVHMPLIYGEGRKKALVRLQKEFQESSKPPSLTPKDDAPWIVPFERNLRFIGRKSQLAQLEEKITVRGGQTTKVAVIGLGGIGKTQLVLELVHRIREKDKVCSVIWIPATNMESLHQAYVDVARQLGIPGSDDEKADMKRLVQEYLSKESAGQWLLVLDNADDINMWADKRESGGLIQYLPKSKQGCIIFTTRDREVAVMLAHQNVVEVPKMNEEAAKELLQKYLINVDLAQNQQDVNALLVQLAYLPLAIVQAAAYINKTGTPLADYLSILADQEEEDTTM